jgi:hypothetical protein
MDCAADRLCAQGWPQDGAVCHHTRFIPGFQFASPGYNYCLAGQDKKRLLCGWGWLRVRLAWILFIFRQVSGNPSGHTSQENLFP